MLDRRATEALAAMLDLDAVRGVACAACLFGVACALDGGKEEEMWKAVRLFAPLLWDEGLAEALEASLARARKADVPGADAASADLEERGVRSAVVGPVVRLLAAEQLQEMERRRRVYMN